MVIQMQWEKYINLFSGVYYLIEIMIGLKQELTTLVICQEVKGKK